MARPTRRAGPALAGLVLLALALIPGTYAFNYFCGCLYQDPIDIQVDTLDRLNQPPIVAYTAGLPFANATDIVSTGTLPDGEPMTVYQYWYFWPGCALAPAATNPLCAAGHINNDWEPLYVFWKTTNPLAPTLLAVWYRLHFVWKQTGGSAVELNGTQVLVKMYLASVTILGQTYTGILPTVLSSGPISSFFGTGKNVTIPNNPNAPGYFGQSSWTYAVTNGGPHTVTLTYDPNSPPGLGPTAYEPGAGPADPFSLYGTGRNLQTGLTVGAGVTFLAFLLFTVGAFELRRLVRRPRSRR